MRPRDITKMVASLWEASQVELAGQYSVERFKQLTAFSSDQSFIRIVLRCVLTPMPCIFILLLVDAAPLEPPTNTIRRSPVFWTRGFFVTLLLTLGGLAQCTQHLPQLQLSRREVLCIAILATLAGFVCKAIMSVVVGNPVPFAMLWGAPAWLTTMVASVYWIKGPSLRNHDQDELKKDVFAYVLFSILRMSLVVIYPAYMFVFLSLRGHAQSVCVLVLPLIKVVAKYLMAKTLRQHDDLKPEALIFNVDIFHALFVSYSMQNASSFGSTLLLMTVDVGHAWLTIRDVNHLANGIVEAARAVGYQHRRVRISGPPKMSILRFATLILERDRTLTDHPFIRSSTARAYAEGLASLRQTTSTPALRVKQLSLTRSVSFPASNQITPEPPMAHTGDSIDGPSINTIMKTQSQIDLDGKEAQSVITVGQTLKLLYVTEFIVLMEYIEIIVPFIFSVYMLMMFYLPNRAYYPMLRNMSDDQLRNSVINVLIYALLELLSLVAISLVLWWKLRLSALRQLAFVLEKHWITVQWALVFWVLYVVEATLEHLGSDYTFRFAWLRHPTA